MRRNNWGGNRKRERDLKTGLRHSSAEKREILLFLSPTKKRGGKLLQTARLGDIGKTGPISKRIWERKRQEGVFLQ